MDLSKLTNIELLDLYKAVQEEIFKKIIDAPTEREEIKANFFDIEAKTEYIVLPRRDACIAWGSFMARYESFVVVRR
jgi:hypothetical protein